jgi:hypothetical protein
LKFYYWKIYVIFQLKQFSVVVTQPVTKQHAMLQLLQVHILISTDFRHTYRTQEVSIDVTHQQYNVNITLVYYITRAHTHTHTHTHTRARTYTLTHARTHAHTYKFTHTDHTHTNTHTHKITHTTHTQTHTNWKKATDSEEEATTDAVPARQIQPHGCLKLFCIPDGAQLRSG